MSLHRACSDLPAFELPNGSAREDDSSSARWERLRSPPLPADQVVSGLGSSWLATLPGDVRPASLVRCYPRIVNRLALVWADPVLTARYFDSLLIDHRGNRLGFPAPVMADLIRLHTYFRQVHPAPTEAAASLQMLVVEPDWKLVQR